MPILELPKELENKIKEFPQVDWSEVARGAFIKKIKRLEALKKFEKLLEKSKFTEEDALNLSRKVGEERLKQLKKQGLI